MTAARTMRVFAESIPIESFIRARLVCQIGGVAILHVRMAGFLGEEMVNFIQISQKNEKLSESNDSNLY